MVMRLVGLLISVVVVIACQPRPKLEPKRAPDLGPPVDPECLRRARAGVLLDGLPTEAAGFEVVSDPARGQVLLRRAGRSLTAVEGATLWKTLSENSFGGARLGHAGSALHSMASCPGVAKASCLELSLWQCQTSVADLARVLAGATEGAGVGDGELEAMVYVVESRGPACTSACTPAPHYSQRGVYDQRRGRTPIANLFGAGACEQDGDCDGRNSNRCISWYLRGGWEDLIYIRLPQPAFCGCVDRACSWFVQ
jgi:hypothetical protein